MQDTQAAQAVDRQAIYMAALTELEKLQREIDFEQVANQRLQKQKRIRQQTLLAGGVLLGSLMSVVTLQVAMPAVFRPLSESEAAAIHNLVDYVALRQVANDRWINRALCTHFGVEEIHQLQGADYEAAVFYLLRLAG